MKTPKRIFRLVFWLLLSFLIFSLTESKAQHKKMSAKDLTQESTAILYGKCSKIKSEWNEKQDIIFTYVTIIPEEYVKGNLGPEAVITIPGGRVGDIIYEVSEMPVFIEGEEVVAFIWKHPSGKNLVTGGFQGKLKIEKDKQTGQRTVKGKDKTQKPKKVKLDDFINEVKGYLNN